MIRPSVALLVAVIALGCIESMPPQPVQPPVTSTAAATRQDGDGLELPAVIEGDVFTSQAGVLRLAAQIEDDADAVNLFAWYRRTAFELQEEFYQSEDGGSFRSETKPLRNYWVWAETDGETWTMRLEARE